LLILVSFLGLSLMDLSFALFVIGGLGRFELPAEASFPVCVLFISDNHSQDLEQINICDART